ncbi:hypothetical protein L204_100346 [Cryptococcus depauperatus]|nr:hypothetical protein L204_02171 [Cryptococcus depauperatus CBS 7855]
MSFVVKSIRSSNSACIDSPSYWATTEKAPNSASRTSIPEPFWIDSKKPLFFPNNGKRHFTAPRYSNEHTGYASLEYGEQRSTQVHPTPSSPPEPQPESENEGRLEKETLPQPQTNPSNAKRFCQRLYPFILPPDLWNESVAVEHSECTTSAIIRTPMLPLHPFLFYKTPTPATVSQSTALVNDIPVHLGPHMPDPQFKNFSVPPALHDLPSHSSVCVSSSTPHPYQPGKSGQLVWLDAETTCHALRGGRITVRDHRGHKRSCHSLTFKDMAHLRHQSLAMKHSDASSSKQSQKSSRKTPSRGVTRKTTTHRKPLTASRVDHLYGQLNNLNLQGDHKDIAKTDCP